MKVRVLISSILSVAVFWIQGSGVLEASQNPFPKTTDAPREDVFRDYSGESAASDSPVIDSVWVDGEPVRPFSSQGDLWMNTWADDDNLYSGWGDGEGVAHHGFWTDCGIARFIGSLPQIQAEERCFLAPTAQPVVNDKPSSLLFFGGRLYGQFHSPLGDPWIGYLAFSDDYGETWTRVGFFREGEIQPENASPWTREKNSNFRCLFFMNMGQDYGLNTDGYVYALGIGTEWAWFGGVRLVRVRKEDILLYGAWEYWTGESAGEQEWSSSQTNAAPLPGIRTSDQGSAIFHHGIDRFLFLTSMNLFDAPEPWGPWTHAGQWTGRFVSESWQGGYQPGIISKDIGPDFFWFTISGQNDLPKVPYRLNLGKMVMKIHGTGAGDPVLPAALRLDQNHPNPFNTATVIRYELPGPCRVRLAVFDASGRCRAGLADGFKEAGVHSVRLEGSDMPSGVYFIRLEAGPNIFSRKCILLK